MHIYHFLFVYCIAAASLSLPEVRAAQPSAAPKQNVIFFLVDDLGWSDVRYQGSTAYRTPNIDAFARRGVRFTQAYAACPVCSPTRASILTGQYPARLRLTDWLPGRRNFPFQKLLNCETVQQLPEGEATLPRVLKENGYRTAIFGKWHLGDGPDSATKQGFDLQVPRWNKGWPNGTYFSPFGMEGLKDEPAGSYLTDCITGEALAWVEQNKEQPFFLYLAHFAVHDPIQGRPDLVARNRDEMKADQAPAGPPFRFESNPDDPHTPSASAESSRYQGFSLLPGRTVKIKQRQDNPEFAAMVESMDQSLGRVLARLKDLNLHTNTIVVFFSDNGGMSAANFGNPNRKIARANLDKNYATSNLPLRAGKGWLYEGGIRVPLVIYRPGASANGTASDVPVISTDFYPTILDLLNVPPENAGHNGRDGMSLLPILNSDAAGTAKIAQRAIYWHWPHYSNHGAQSPGGAIRQGGYKLIEYFENHTVQLFNLRDDPGETLDLAPAEPAKARELRNQLENWRQTLNADMPRPNPNYDPSQIWPGEG